MFDKYGLLTAPIAPTLRKLTIPTTLGMVAVLTFSLVDTFFISLLGTHALAAVSFTFPVTFAINCITMGIGVGVSNSLGRLLGKGDSQHAASFATHGLLLALVLVTVAALLGLGSMSSLFALMGAEKTLVPLIEQYMHIWYAAIPLLVIPMVGSSAIRATGNTRTPASIMIAAGAANGVLDPLLIFGPGPFPQLGIQGAAIASALSWLGACIGALYILIKRDRILGLPQLTRIKQDWLQILKIGTPAAISNAMNPLCGAILMAMLAGFGTTAVAAYGAAQRIEAVLLLVIMSLSSALTPFLAQNLGAGNAERSFRGLFLAMRFAIIFQSIIFLMMVPLSIPFSAMFSREQAVRDIIWHYLLIVPFSYGFQGVVMILISGLNALHRPLRAFQWSFMRLFIFTLPFAWLGAHLYGLQGLFAGIAAGNLLGGVLGYLYALHVRRSVLKK